MAGTKIIVREENSPVRTFCHPFLLVLKVHLRASLTNSRRFYELTFLPLRSATSLIWIAGILAGKLRACGSYTEL